MSDPSTKELIEAAREVGYKHLAGFHQTDALRTVLALADRLEEVEEGRDRWRGAAIQAKDDLRAIEASFRDATPVGEDGPNPPIGPGHVFAAWTSPANTMRWIEQMENEGPDSPEPSDPEPEQKAWADMARIARRSWTKENQYGEDPEEAKSRLNDLLSRALEGLRKREGEDVDAWAERLGADIHRAASEDPEPGHSPWCDGTCGEDGLSSISSDYCPGARKQLGSEPEHDPWEAADENPWWTALLDLRKRVNALHAFGIERDRHRAELSRRLTTLEGHADRGSEAERELRERVEELESVTRLALRTRGTLRDDLEKVCDHTEGLAERLERLEAEGLGWMKDRLDILLSERASRAVEEGER